MDRLGTLLRGLPHLDLSGQINVTYSTPKKLGAACDIFIGHWNVGSKSILVAIKRVRMFSGKKDLATTKVSPLKVFGSDRNDFYAIDITCKSKTGQGNENLVYA